MLLLGFQQGSIALQAGFARLQAADLTIDPHTATPNWHGERLDLHWAIRVLHPSIADPPRSDLSAGTRSTPDGNEVGTVH